MLLQLRLEDGQALLNSLYEQGFGICVHEGLRNSVTISCAQSRPRFQENQEVRARLAHIRPSAYWNLMSAAAMFDESLIVSIY